MKVTLTAKVRIYPTAEQRALLLAFQSAYTAACNDVSRYIFAKGKPTKAKGLQSRLYRKTIRKHHLPSTATCNVFRTVASKYASARSNGHEFALCEFKRGESAFTRDKDYSLSKGKLSIATLHGRTLVEYDAQALNPYIGDEWKLGTARLVFRNGKTYFHIAVTQSVDEPELSESKVVGCDAGMRFLMTTYDGKDTKFYSGAQVKQKRAKYKRTRTSLQKRQTASARRRLLAIGSRENRFVNDVNHCVSKALVKSAEPNTLFALEDLKGIRKQSEQVRLKQRYYHVSWAYYDLQQKISYKARKRKCDVAYVNRDGTSQICPKCGNKATRSRKTHELRCKCGFRSNDDRAAAMNIRQRGVEYLQELKSA
jgi:IS605 OrfB family transposase